MGKVVTARFHLDSSKFGKALARHTDGRSNFPNVPKSLTKKGNMIAILYAMRHDFEDGSIGFRIENANQVQFFPCTLERFLTLGDRILSSDVSQSDGVQACYRCNSTASQRCSGCHVTWYCGEDCHVGDRSDGGHENDCKLLNEVATLMKQDRKHCPKELRFPLPKREICVTVS
ncbi:hypothetical protein EI94DRAFT_892574 [Lactarius quietus]|nr:hypothetical protein EI94DRAFT_892574 [Lactarius quietus]